MGPNESGDVDGQKQHQGLTRANRPVRRLGSIVNQLPTVIVLASLAAVGWWGHRTGWKAPHFSELTSRNAQNEKEDWCNEHNVPDSRCIKCHPELVGANMKDWCLEHGVPESKCTVCHPEILKTGVAGDWCPEHGVPESSCTICHPELAVKGKPPADDAAVRVTQSAPAVVGAFSGTGRAVDPAPSLTSRPSKDPKTCQTHVLRVQFASAGAVRKAGVRLGSVTERPMRAMVKAASQVEYDRTRLVQLSTPVVGRVWRVDREVGQPVKAGQIIALIDAAEVGKAKAELLEQLAEFEFRTKSFERAKNLSETSLVSKARFEEASAAARVAKMRAFNAHQTLANLGLAIEQKMLNANLDETQIRFLGLPPEVVKTLDSQTITANLIPIRSPIEGTVIALEAVAGEMVEPNKMLFKVADTRRMWVMVDVPQGETRDIAIGQQVAFRPDGSIDQIWRGQVSWISTAIEDQTRTVRVRAEVDNPDAKLRAHTFGTTEILIRQADKAIVVPNEAIQWEGCCHIVFVRLTDDIFQVRKVKLGAKNEHFTEIKVGVLPGEVIAMAGSHVLTSEILKSNLGAGCCAE